MPGNDSADKFDQLVNQLQSRIDEEEAKAYSKKTLEEARNPSNLGPMEGADITAHRVGTCGDSMEMFIRVDGERLVDVTFVTDGCGATLACGSMLTKMARGRTVDEAMSIRVSDLIGALDGLPEENLHCADLAIGTLHGAVNAFRSRG